MSAYFRSLCKTRKLYVITESLWHSLCIYLISDLKAVENDKTCTLPEASGSAPQEIDPNKENEVLFTYSVHWEVSNSILRYIHSSSQTYFIEHFKNKLTKVLYRSETYYYYKLEKCEGRRLKPRVPSVQESEVKWASRWDTYLTMSDVQIHWFSIVNSVVVVFFLSGTSSFSFVQLASCPEHYNTVIRPVKFWGL